MRHRHVGVDLVDCSREPQKSFVPSLLHRDLDFTW